eukprot:TRINITY_DN7187_c0_g1_i2.p1 TRINITY_DN7187_c0_g1~~TRINITY_DN7187_c0_g1_i2.p1  ORF type:complete len:629 (-),score=31.34 TRINITY_DN7187_c0_g1_i2:130-2016(-)
MSRKATSSFPIFVASPNKHIILSFCVCLGFPLISLCLADFVGTPTSLQVTRYTEGSYLIPQSKKSAEVASHANLRLSQSILNERMPTDTFRLRKSTQTLRKKNSSGSKSKPLIGGSKETPFSKVAAKSHDYLQRFPGISHYQMETSGTGYYKGTQAPGEPPDLGMAVGNGYVVQAVNFAIRVYNASNGAPLVGTTPTNQFFNMTYAYSPNTNFTVSGDFLADPRVLYDPLVKRWFVFVWGTRGFHVHRLPPATFQLIAVSYSKNPLSGFRYYYYNTALTGTDLHRDCPCIPDYQMVGVDAYGVHITANAFAGLGTLVGAQIYVLSKKKLLRGGDKFFAQAFDGSSGNNGHILQDGEYADSIQPAHFPPSSSPALGHGGTQFFLSTFSNKHDNRVEVWAVTNTGSIDAATPALSLQQVTVKLSFTYSLPPSSGAFQKGGVTPLTKEFNETLQRLDLGDCRMQQVVFSNGYLFGAFTTAVFDPSGNVDRSGIAWVVIKPSFNSARKLYAQIIASGVITIEGLYAVYPAITVNFRRAVIGFALSGRSIHPTLAYVYIPFSTYKASNVRYAWQGTMPEDGYSGLFGGISRWGDYFASTTDEKGRFWISGETIVGGARTLYANWGTYIAQLPI